MPKDATFQGCTQGKMAQTPAVRHPVLSIAAARCPVL
jgi:hypothetical protein